MVQELTHKADTESVIISNQAAFELALCHLLAFGTEQDIPSSHAWLERSGRTSDDLFKEAAKAKVRRDYHGPLRDPELSKFIEYNPGDVYRRTGLLHRAIEVLRFEVIGKVGSEVVHSMLHLKAHLSHLLGHRDYDQDLEEQEFLGEEILSLTEKICGPENEDTLLAMSNLGRYKNARGKLADAEKLQRTVLEIRTSALGIDHPLNLKAMDDLAMTLALKGDTAEAVRLLDHARNRHLDIFGSLSPRTITSTRHLARVMSGQGDLATAERLCRSAVEASKEFYREGHEDEIKSKEDLSEVLLKKGQTDEALLVCKASLEIRTRLYGEDSEEVSDHMRRHVERFRRYGKAQDGLAMQQEIFERSKKRNGETHVVTIKDHSRLGMILYECGNYDEAAVVHAKIWEIRKVSLGPDHEETISASRLRSLLIEEARAHE